MSRKLKFLGVVALSCLFLAGLASAASIIHVEIPFSGTASTVVSGTCTTPGKGTRTCSYSRTVAIPYSGTAVTDVTVPGTTTGTTTTTPAPTNAIAIDTPADGATVSGAVSFTASTSGATPSDVVLTVDGGGASTEFEAPYVYNGDGNRLDTTTLANGTHTLGARANYSDGSSASAAVSVTVDNTTTPPPPPTAGHIKGPVLFRYGSSWASAPSGGYDRYGAVVVGYGDDANAAALPTAKALTYKTMAEVFTGCVSSDLCLSGVSAADAQAAGVRLPVTGSGGGGTYYMADVGSSVYQDLWVQKVSARLASKGLDGVFIDNVVCDFIDGLDHSAGSTKYPDASSQRAAAVSFITNVGAQMKARGYYVLANTFCYGGGGGDHAANTGWWQAVAPHVGGAITETFEQDPSGNYYNLRFDCPSCSWLGDWRGRLDVIDAAQSAGTDAWELTSAVDSTSAAGKAVAEYACASFLLRWNGTGGGCGVNVMGPDPWDAGGWAYPIGLPTGAMTASGAGFYRTFSGGRVIVNPSTSTSTVSGVSLAPKTAYIGA